MSGETESVLKPLPAEKLCNKWGEGNPINGDGPLGNKNKEKMHYIGSDREELVKTVQMMLKTLGYDLGTSGPDENGIDGYFGDTTEEYVIDFQKKNKDWDGESLKEEGKVGPRSSDALNRAMVGKQYVKQNWYDYYQTPVKLTSESVLLTATAKALENLVPIEIDDEKKGKVVIVGKILEIITTCMGARLSSRFSLRKTFPKPSSLPLVQEIAKRAGQDPSMRVLIIGHTDAEGDDLTNYQISIARARAVAKLLVGDKEFFRERFDKPDVLSQWSWEEIQWMLNAIEIDGDPLYAGLIDNHFGTLTRRALARFQLSKKLDANYLCDEATLMSLIETYLSLIGQIKPEMKQIELAGGGSWHPPHPFGKQHDAENKIKEKTSLYQQEFRRVDVFLFNKSISPPTSSCPPNRHENCRAFQKWCESVTEEIERSRGFTMSIQLLDSNDSPLGNKEVIVQENQNDQDIVTIAVLHSSSNGMIKLTMPAGLYSVKFEHGGQDYVDSFYLHSDDVGGMIVRTTDILED